IGVPPAIATRRQRRRSTAAVGLHPAHMRRAQMMLERDRKALADTVVVVVIMALQNRTGTTRSIGRSRAAPPRVAVRPKDCRGSPFSTVKAGRTPNPTALVGPASRRPTWR